MEFQECITEVDCTNHEDFIKNNLSVLHLFSDFDMDSLMLLPTIETIAEEFSSKISFGKASIEELDFFAKKYNINRAPSALFFKNGELIDKIEKISSEDFLRNKLFSLI